MKESSKERLATLLMDELLERLSTRESLRKMLGEMASLPIDEVIQHLLADFERAVTDYHQKYLPAIKQAADNRSKQPAEHAVVESSKPDQMLVSATAVQSKQDVQPVATWDVPPVESKPAKKERSSAEPVVEPPMARSPKVEHVDTKPAETSPVFHKEQEKKPPTQKSLQLDPIKLEFPKIRLKVRDVPVESTPAPPQHPVTISRSEPKKEPVAPPVAPKEEADLQKLDDLARRLESEYAAKARQQQLPASPPRQEEELKDEEAELFMAEDVSGNASATIEDDDEIDTVELIGSSKHTTHARYTFADDEYAYVHAVSRIPEGEGTLSEAFMLEEKGIDGHSFAFALDYAKMRFYLSKVNPNEMNVSKSMVLLLNKQESLQLQGIHESTLNDLRGHSVLLPFEFGTVARGKDSLLNIIDRNLDDLEEALDDVEQTTWWTVTASVLDVTIARIVGTDVQSVGRDRSRERASYTSAPQGKKFDIKVLERILQREKKLAESVHAELSAVADRADIDTIVGLGSGSSEDWKVILKASYDVPKRDIARFSRAVTDMQYHHLQYDLMLALTGNQEHFTLRRK